jgi:hypothetical protein
MRRSAIDVYLESDVNTKLQNPAHITTITLLSSSEGTVFL